jgi:hypothetical protein
VRVVIVDPDLKAGRKLAASVEALVPAADVLLYATGDEALAGIDAHRPDVAFVGAAIGPAFVAEALAAHDEPKYVGMVDEPSPEASEAWIAAGAKIVVAHPVDTLGIRSALRNTGGGIAP